MKSKSIIAIITIATTVLFSCGSSQQEEQINSEIKADSVVQQPVSYINNEMDCKNFLNGKIFYGPTYRIEISNEGKLKVFKKNNNDLFFESTPGKQLEIGELKNDGRWISIRGGEWTKQAINGLMGQLDTKFEFVLLGNETILMIATGDVYSLTDNSPVESDKTKDSIRISDSINTLNAHD